MIAIRKKEYVENSFNGIASFEDTDFDFIADGHMITLISRNKKGRVVLKARPNPLLNKKKSEPHFIFGVNDDGFEVGFLMEPDNIMHGISMANFTQKYAFHSRIILKGTANGGARNKLNEFDAITFSGKTLNKLYSPKIALSKSTDNEILQYYRTGRLSIKIKQHDEYTKSFDAIIFGQKVKITYSILSVPLQKDFETDSLGSLKTYFRIEFEERQNINSLEKYYFLMRDFVSLLVGQRNVTFDMQLNLKNASDRFNILAYSKIYDECENHYDSSYTHAIPVVALKDKLPKALEILTDEEKKSPKPYLRFLPDNNRKANFADYDNIRDLCAALEIEYNCLKKLNLKPSNNSKTLDIVKAEVLEVVNKYKHSLSKKTYDSITGNLGRWNLSAAEQSFELYKRYKRQVDVFIDSVNKHRDNKIIIAVDSIGKFIKIRNGIAHSGNADMDIAEINLFAFLKCLIYFSIFERIGLKPSKTAQLVSEVVFRCDLTQE